MRLVGLLVGVTCFAQQAYFMGERVCRSCHDLSFHTWRLSDHAGAYAALFQPISTEIALLSGIDEAPAESPICLGCHTTASEALDWQLDPGFRFEDGLQCEACHGPGSEHVVDSAPMRRPSEQTCLVCHLDKQSHTKVLGPHSFSFTSDWERIRHDSGTLKSKQPASRQTPTDSNPQKVKLGPGVYVGERYCLSCHLGNKSEQPGEGSPDIHATWRESKHAAAYARVFEKQVIGKPCGSAAGTELNCLVCHQTGWLAPVLESFDAAQGVQCESCHGPGGDYLDATLTAPTHAPTRPIDKKTCQVCHLEDDFEFKSSLKLVSHFYLEPEKGTEPIYKTPQNLVVSTDGQRLYVACEGSDSLIVIQAESGRILAEIEVENLPYDVCLTPDGETAIVSNRGTDSASLIDTESLRVTGRIDVGDEPHGVVTDKAGRFAYVANAGSADVSIIDLEKRDEVRRLSAARGTWGVERAPKTNRILVTNNLSHFVSFRTPCLSEVTEIDASLGVVQQRHMVSQANMLQGVAFSPDERFALVTSIRTKNLVPITRVMQGWVMTNGVSVIWRDGRIDQLLLDEVDQYFADPTDVAVSSDGRYGFISGSGVNEVAVLNLQKMEDVLTEATDDQRMNLIPNHLGLASELVLKRIPVGISPRGLAMAPNGKELYVANALSDSVSVISLSDMEVVRTINLGGPKVISLRRKGERIFHSADVTYGSQFSCHSCHPDGGIDGITYDIEPDGLGLNPVDNRTLKGILDTAPFKWTGKNPSLSRQCGPRLAVFFTRIDPFTPEQVEALDHYICTIPRNPNRYRIAGTRTDAQERGRQLFIRERDNTGKSIPVENRCVTCHPGPYYTSRIKADMKIASTLDTHSNFDIPHLNNIYESAPYLHDGRANTLEEIWTRFNPDDTHGATNDMTKDQLNDLVAYLLTL